ncbi:MAG TPA: hypothetical protein VKY85_14025 [Candidatus Angelobacter sp.]|nr:hypothetical protein [Candidatus Angelobacter sp.]
MSKAIFKGETNIKDLVTRLFPLSDKSPQKIKEAGDALLQANPQLKDLSKVPAGALLQIPAGAPPLRAAEKAPEIIFRREAVARQAQQASHVVGQRLADIETRAQAGLQAFASLAKSSQAQDLMKQLNLSEGTKQITASIDSLSKSMGELQKVRNQAIGKLQTSLQSFLK